jgi:hypothetical protein
MSVTATPAEGARIALADLGVEVRQVRVRVLSARLAGSGAMVRATVGPDAIGMRAEVRTGSAVIGRGTVGSGGRIVVRTSRTGVRARLVLLGDSRRIGTTVPVVLPG